MSSQIWVFFAYPKVFYTSIMPVWVYQEMVQKKSPNDKMHTRMAQKTKVVQLGIYHFCYSSSKGILYNVYTKEKTEFHSVQRELYWKNYPYLNYRKYSYIFFVTMFFCIFQCTYIFIYTYIYIYLLLTRVDCRQDCYQGKLKKCREIYSDNVMREK
jgi:hypothetical protein